MNEIIYQKSYQEYKQELDGVLQQTAEGFVRIGYLLKVARDTNILAESGYSSVTEFAQKEYGIDKTQVSRFIHINDMFAEDGYSDRLQEKYQGFGYAKLTLMLQLPEEINEELSPNYSKTEIQAIKEEVEKESQISDIEVMLETPVKTATEYNALETTIKKLWEDEPELFERVYKHLTTTTMDVEGLKSILAPAGEKTYTVRIMGLGRVMLTLNEAEEIALIPVRHPEEKEKHTWEELEDTISLLIPDYLTMEEAYREITGQQYPIQETVEAPAKEEPKKKESKVTKAKEPKKEKIAPVQPSKQLQLNDIDENIPAKAPVEEEKQEEEIEEKPINTKWEEDIPGQDDIMNHPEYLPEHMVDTIPPENAINTKCEADSKEVDKHVIAGYKAGIASGIRRMEQLYQEGRWAHLITAAQDIIWRAEQIQEAENE